ncbi:AraC-like DNA-binding protein [Phyllobacterium trifolii]|uniref:AraC-like DNA-binding protein n=1 Tax=Phyllobacterium trifolii TaxID=300193 RepID=A0A839UM24_9HYPH|nr:AraC family transcriptional regulator [Phyllobacterium trifolii]MBB3149930.1 AraC-like DNA-binding protein [Phyllobacterium trifolii]
MDTLSKIFAAPRIKEAKFTRLEASAPWGIVSPGERVVKFVHVVGGSAVLTTPDSFEPTRLLSGDVFLLLDDAAYKIFDDERSLLIDCVDVERGRVGDRIEFGGGGATTTFNSGSFEIERFERDSVLDVLPQFLHLKESEGRTAAFASVLDMLAVETAAPGLGADAAVARLFELLFIHAIRAYARDDGSPKRGWLAAVSDHRLKSVIEAIHADPARDWTIDALARTAGMSRSAFAVHFKNVLEQTPLEYLTAWRVHCASALLVKSSSTISEVARKAGYGSDAAFNKVFKRVTGHTPAMFRKANGVGPHLGTPRL